MPSIVATGSITIVDVLDGAKAGTLRLYTWRGVTAPALPTKPSTFNWTTGEYTYPAVGQAADGWTAALPASSTPGQVLYSVEKPITDPTGSATSVNVPASFWTGTVARAVSSLSAVPLRCYSKASGSGLAPSGTTTTADASTYPTAASFGVTFLAAFTAAQPALGDNETLWISDGTQNPLTGMVTWSTPYIATFKVGSLSALTIKTGALTVDNTLTIGTQGSISSGQAAFSTGKGFWIGKEGNTTKFSLGLGDVSCVATAGAPDYLQLNATTILYFNVGDTIMFSTLPSNMQNVSTTGKYYVRTLDTLNYRITLSYVPNGNDINFISGSQTAAVTITQGYLRFNGTSLEAFNPTFNNAITNNYSIIKSSNIFNNDAIVLASDPSFKGASALLTLNKGTSRFGGSAASLIVKDQSPVSTFIDEGSVIIYSYKGINNVGFVNLDYVDVFFSSNTSFSAILTTYSFAPGTRIFLAAQNTATQNGIYQVSEAGTLVRAGDADTFSKLRTTTDRATFIAGTPIQGGYGNQRYVVTASTASTGTLGTTPVYFELLGTNKDYEQSMPALFVGGEYATLLSVETGVGALPTAKIYGGRENAQLDVYGKKYTSNLIPNAARFTGLGQNDLENVSFASQAIFGSTSGTAASLVGALSTNTLEVSNTGTGRSANFVNSATVATVQVTNSTAGNLALSISGRSTLSTASNLPTISITNTGTGNAIFATTIGPSAAVYGETTGTGNFSTGIEGRISGNLGANNAYGVLGQITNASSGINTVGVYGKNAGRGIAVVGEAAGSGIGGVFTATSNVALEARGTLRSTGISLPTSGAGIELTYNGSIGYLVSYNRSTSTALPLHMLSSETVLGGTTKVPATSTTTGVRGQIAWGTDFIYVCTATNVWRRAALSSW